MTFLRHAPRQVHHTVAAYIEAGLLELGWTSADAAERPFGADKLKILRTSDIIDGGREKLVANTVSISLGSESHPDELELGGALSSQDYPIFVDVLMPEDALAVAVASDIRDHLLGRFEFSSRRIDVIDQVLQTAVPGWRIELDDIERVKPEVGSLPMHWQVVKVTATAEFLEVRF